MKSFFNIIIFFFISITLFSCASSQTFYVNGTPGTIITTPSNERIAQIDNSGQAKITFKRKLGYLLEGASAGDVVYGFESMMLMGGLTTLFGSGLGMWGGSMEQLDRNYDYLENQSINNDIIQ